MKVIKFGGASVNSIERIRSLGQIMAAYAGQKVLVVISAMGKTTNALENVAEAFFTGKKESALALFNAVKQDHLQTASELLASNYQKTIDHLGAFFTEAEWLLHDKPVRDYNYYYDQIVCLGEFLSTSIISAYLNETGIQNQWIDVRDILRTDNNFREAAINWDYSSKRVHEIILPAFTTTDVILTQGFIGSTDENESTTLGREGSDYSAAVFASLLHADSQTIWKDVAGVMNADPKKFEDAVLIGELNYNEVIEMAYYGAQIIHPKTIKPLQNRAIPLYVKCFLHPELPGTVIHDKSLKGLPPIIVVKETQVLMQLSSINFSFVGEHAIGELYHLFEEIRIKPNLTQHGAISILCCMDDQPEKIEKLALAASGTFEVRIEKGLTLLTIRHYTENILDKLVAGKQVVLKQQSTETVQVLMR